MSGEFRVELRDEGVLWLTFDRPAARNAMTFAMYEAIAAAAQRANEDEAVRALVLTGSGAAFVAGTDIAQFSDFRTAEQAYGYEEFMERILGALEAVRKPTIAAIGGATTGGGLAIAASCDLRIVGADEALRAGLVHEVVTDDAALHARVAELARTMAAHAPLTLWATKEGLRRIRERMLPPDDAHDLVALCYTSEDFQEGVRAFIERRRPRWSGR